MIKRKFKVATLNYPLMNPRIPVKDVKKYFELDYTNRDPWEVPLYIHIPFCNSICNFCIYNRQLIDKNSCITDKYVDALIKEIIFYGNTPYVQSLKIGAVYFGGGTPTSLTSKQLDKIIKACREYLPLKKDVEITVEANPVSTTEEKLSELHRMGVSRISAGIQTFNPTHRKTLGLRKSKEEVIEWINLVKKYPFNVLAIDLMYGLPGQTIEEWKDDLKLAINLPIDHLSIYELSVLAGSKLYEDVKNKKIIITEDSDDLYSMFIEANKMIKKAGYEHHIIPEYNAPNKKCKFWELVYDGYGDNLSMGVSSFGYINGVTYQNIDNIDGYIKAVSKQEFPVKMVSKKANYDQLLERTMLLSLRRRYIEKKIFYQQYGIEINDVFKDILQSHIQGGLLEEDDKNIYLSSKGEYYQEDVCVDYMKSTLGGITLLRKQLAIGQHIVPEIV